MPVRDIKRAQCGCNAKFIALSIRFDEFRKNSELRFVDMARHIADLQRVKDETVKELAIDRANYVSIPFYEREHKVLADAVNDLRAGQAKGIGAREVLTVVAVLIAALIGAVTSHMMSVK